MTEREKCRLPDVYYNFSNGRFCGVLVDTATMKKIAKLQHKYNAEIREVLQENKSKLFVADWTLANKYDENDNVIIHQTTINYTLKNPYRFDDLDKRISMFKLEQPKKISELFMVDDIDQAKTIAKEVLQDELNELIELGYLKGE